MSPQHLNMQISSNHLTIGSHLMVHGKHVTWHMALSPLNANQSLVGSFPCHVVGMNAFSLDAAIKGTKIKKSLSCTWTQRPRILHCWRSFYWLSLYLLRLKTAIRTRFVIYGFKTIKKCLMALLPFFHEYFWLMMMYSIRKNTKTNLIYLGNLYMCCKTTLADENGKNIFV